MVTMMTMINNVDNGENDDGENLTNICVQVLHQGLQACQPDVKKILHTPGLTKKRERHNWQIFGQRRDKYLFQIFGQVIDKYLFQIFYQRRENINLKQMPRQPDVMHTHLYNTCTKQQRLDLTTTWHFSHSYV